MKIIPLRKVNILDASGKTTPLDYKNFIQSSLQFPADVKVGFTTDQIRISCRILEILDKSTDSLSVEDADFAYIKGLITATKFTMAHPEILRFVDTIVNATDKLAEEDLKKEETKEEANA